MLGVALHTGPAAKRKPLNPRTETGASRRKRAGDKSAPAQAFILIVFFGIISPTSATSFFKFSSILKKSYGFVKKKILRPRHPGSNAYRVRWTRETGPEAEVLQLFRPRPGPLLSSTSRPAQKLTLW